MGITIQFESHRVELAAVYEMENDAGVLEYFDQPPAIKLAYESPGGKRMGVLHTPDFFVIRETEAGWEEWKTEESLRRLSERNPNRYCTSDGGRWRCPPGEAEAVPLGLYYRVRSSAEIDWLFQRNIQFLEDYLRAGSQQISAARREAALAYVSAAPGISLERLLDLTRKTATPDDIFTLIAVGDLYVDLHGAPLAEPSRVRVFVTREAASHPNSPGHGTPTATLRCGKHVTWDGRIWEIVNLGERSVSLLSEDRTVIDLPIVAFAALARENRLEVDADERGFTIDEAIGEQLSRASPADLRAATYRSGVIGQYLETGDLPPNINISTRTVFRWLAKYRKTEAVYGSGFLGLLPQSGKKGNYNSKLPESSRHLMEEFIVRDYETLKQKTRYACWIQLKLACESQGTHAPSYKTFCLAVRRRPVVEQTLKRKGHRASYQIEPFYWSLDLKTPRHGDRPFEIAHVDHTELDVECIASSGQVLGRPWMTLLTDSFSRRMLALYLTFDPPSYRSCMMVMRECVRRFSRFPQILVTDGGREFESTYFETLLARYECTKKTRPPSKARFGSTCERLFGIANTQVIHNLRGNTQITRNVRQVTKAVDPKGLATWRLAELHEKLSEYFYEVYDGINHPALGQSPREAFQIALASSGARIHRMVCDNEEFRILTLPTTVKGTAKVMPSRGLKINHVYYWCEAFRQAGGEIVPVRYDPFDIGIAYAFIGKQWLQCHSEFFGILKGRSEREIMLATTELHRRHRENSSTFAITARRLAEFLQSVEAEESLLTQRLRDLESQNIRFGPAADGAAGKMATSGPAIQPMEEETGTATEECAVGAGYGEF